MTDAHDITSGLDLLGDWLDAKGFTEEAGLCTKAMDEINRLKKEISEWQKMTTHFISLNDSYAEQIEIWMKEAKEQMALHEKAYELGFAEGRLAEIQERELHRADVNSPN